MVSQFWLIVAKSEFIIFYSLTQNIMFHTSAVAYYQWRHWYQKQSKITWGK